MTGLKNFINEDKQLQAIKNDCSYFLNKYPRLTLYRGYKKLFTINKFMPRKDREPLNSNPIGSKSLDKASKKIFGWPCRSQGTFTSPIYSEAKSYGLPYIFLPIGSSWKYIYAPGMSDSIELTNDLENVILYVHDTWKYINVESMYKFEKFKKFLQLNRLNDEKLFKEIKSLYDMIDDENVSNTKIERKKKELTKKILDGITYAIMKNKYTDKNLNLVTNEEVIFNCQKDGFYLIDPDIYDPRLL